LLHEQGGKWPPLDAKPDAEALTLTAYLNDWFDGKASGDAPERVVALYRHNLATHVVPEIGTTTLAELRRRDLNELVQTLYAKGLAKNTIRNVIAPLTKALNAAVDDELIDKAAGLSGLILRDLPITKRPHSAIKAWTTSSARR
jgi:hypothetical protein